MPTAISFNGLTSLSVEAAQALAKHQRPLRKQQDRIRQLTDRLNSLPTGADERRITSAIVGRSWLFANMHRDNVVTDRQQRNLDAIENCAEHLLAIVNNVLAFHEHDLREQDLYVAHVTPITESTEKHLK